MLPTVCDLAVAPVKAMAMCSREHVAVGRSGVEDDRRFYVVGDDDEVLTARDAPRLAAIQPTFDPEAGRLMLSYPDGTATLGPLQLGEPLRPTLFGKARPGRVVLGPFGTTLSMFLERPTRLVMADRSGLGWDEAPVSLVSRASIERLAAESGVPFLDARRFRMLVTLDGLDAHEEDRWRGAQVRVGSALLRVTEPLGRCAVITRHPGTGARDWDGLRTLARYRGTGNVCLGVNAEVLVPGEIALGDGVAAAQRTPALHLAGVVQAPR